MAFLEFSIYIDLFGNIKYMEGSPITLDLRNIAFGILLYNFERGSIQVYLQKHILLPLVKAHQQATLIAKRQDLGNELPFHS